MDRASLIDALDAREAPAAHGAAAHRPAAAGHRRLRPVGLRAVHADRQVAVARVQVHEGTGDTA